jgi:AraC-like DNA-binding protein
VTASRHDRELDRVAERRRAAALARHYRDVEQLSIAEIARRLGRAPATVKAYLYDPTGEKAKAVKARYRGYCRTCGAETSPRNGKGDAYDYCRRCHRGAAAPKWTRARVREAMRRWAELYGAAPSSYDWSATHARRRGTEAMRRLERGEWPAPATVSELYGTWAMALADAFRAIAAARATARTTTVDLPELPGARSVHGQRRRTEI